MTFFQDFMGILLKDQYKPLVCAPDQSLSRAQVKVSLESIMGGLQNTIDKPNTVLAIQEENSLDLALVILSSLMAGFKVLTLNPGLSPKEVERALLNVSCEYSVGTKPIPKLNFISFNELKNSEYSFSNLSSQSGSFLLLTSGTSGEPKILEADIDRHWAAAKSFVETHDFLSDQSKFWNFYPMSYNAGLLNLLLVPVASGGDVFITDSFNVSWALKFWKVIEEQQINVLWFNPTVLRILYKIFNNKKDFSSLMKSSPHNFIGMSSISDEEKKQYEDWLGINIYENYALTEAQFITTEYPLSGKRNQGRVLPDIKLKLEKNADGVDELWVKSPFFIKGYYKNTQFKELKLKDGFLNTGDIGEINDDARVRITGRNKEVIKKGGLLVNLLEIENVVKSFSGISDSKCCPIPDPVYGESYLLFISLEPSQLPENEIQVIAKKIKSTIAHFKFPQELIILQEFERSDSGKISRTSVLKKLETEDGILARCKAF